MKSLTAMFALVLSFNAYAQPQGADIFDPIQAKIMFDKIPGDTLVITIMSIEDAKSKYKEEIDQLPDDGAVVAPLEIYYKESMDYRCERTEYFAGYEMNAFAMQFNEARIATNYRCFSKH